MINSTFLACFVLANALLLVATAAYVNCTTNIARFVFRYAPILLAIISLIIFLKLINLI